MKLHKTGADVDPAPVIEEAAVADCESRKPPRLFETRSVICFKVEFCFDGDLSPCEKTDSRHRHSLETTWKKGMCLISNLFIH